MKLKKSENLKFTDSSCKIGKQMKQKARIKEYERERKIDGNKIRNQVNR